MKELNRKILRKEKRLKYEENLRNKRCKKAKPCRITKGEHVFDMLVENGYGKYKQYTLACRCGKRTWNVDTIRPLSQLPKYTICEKHGYLHGENKVCWACQLGLEPFDTNFIPKIEKIQKWTKLDDILLDFCINPNCEELEDHKILKRIVRERLIELIKSKDPTS